MSSWYEVFDNEQVQLVTRKQAALLTGVVFGMIGVTAGVFAVAHTGILPVAAAALLLFVAWFFVLHAIVGRLYALRRIVWCIKVSGQQVVGYDHARRKTVIDWLHVQRVDLAPAGLVIQGPERVSLEVPHLFPDFPKLSHRIVAHADAYGVPVFVNGQPWQELNVYALFPILQHAAGDTPGTLN